MMRGTHVLACAILLLTACPEERPPLFTEQQSYFYADRTPLAVRIADLDDDGDVDAVVVNAAEPQVSLHWNSGEGLVKAATMSLATTETVVDVHVTELSGAAPPDLAVLLDRGVAVLTNQGRGRFEVEAGGRVAPCQDCTALVPGDFTGDGVNDLYLVGAGLSDLFPGPDHLTLQDPPPPLLAAPPAPVTANLDGDPATDLVALRITDQAGPEVVGLRGGGDGTFLDMTAPMPDLRVEVRVLAAADLDLDGHDDAIAAGPGWLGAWLTTAGGFGPLLRHEVEGLDPISLDAFDATGDGRLDVVVGDAAGRVHVFVGGSGVTFLTPMILEPGPTPSSLAHGDLDGDGVDDLAIVAEGTCCPVAGAALRVYSGGPVTGDPPSITLH